MTWRGAAFAVALALPAVAPGADWVRVEAPDQHQHFYDGSKLVIEQDTITFWRRVLFRAPQPARGGSARMAMYRESIDCARHTYRSLGYLLYAQDGGVLDNVYTPEAPPEPIIPETVGDRFEALMCVFVDQKQLSQAKARAELPAEASATQIRAQIERLEAELDALRTRLQDAVAREGASSTPPATERERP